jgi:hypothetical protein
MPLETILSEMAVERKSVVEPLLIDQSEAGAINETEFFVIVSHEDRLGCLLDRLCHSKDFDLRLIEPFHEFNGRMVADLEADQSVGFGEDEIRC